MFQPILKPKIMHVDVEIELYLLEKKMPTMALLFSGNGLAGQQDIELAKALHILRLKDMTYFKQGCKLILRDKP